jgi:hypothetical protein
MQPEQEEAGAMETGDKKPGAAHRLVAEAKAMLLVLVYLTLLLGALTK